MIAQAMARAGAGARPVDVLRVHDRRGIGPARQRVLRRAPAAADGAGRRQHQHRRHQLPRAARATSCCSAPTDRRSGRWPTRWPKSAAASSARISIPSAATSSARTTSRSPRPACRRCRSASRSSSTGPNAAELKKKQEAYNDTDYHQPSDEFDPAWDFSGAVEDMKLLAQLAWRDRRRAGDAALQRRRPVRQRAQARPSDATLVTPRRRSRAAAERVARRGAA